MIDILAKPGSVIQLGHSGENDAVRVCFSLKAFQHVFPGGVPSLLVKRNGDKTSYPVPLEVDDAFAFWLVSNADTEKHGLGECELHWVINDILVKTDKFKFLVKEALDGGSEPPDPAGKAWYEKIESEIGDLSKLTTKAKENLVVAINEAASAGAVRYDIAQELTDGQQAQARENIGVIQGDWQQNDTAKSDYVKNRPGGYDIVTESEEVTVEITNDNYRNYNPVWVSRIGGANHYYCKISNMPLTYDQMSEMTVGGKSYPVYDQGNGYYIMSTSDGHFDSWDNFVYFGVAFSVSKAGTYPMLETVDGSFIGTYVLIHVAPYGTELLGNYNVIYHTLPATIPQKISAKYLDIDMMIAATDSENGKGGVVPSPLAGDQNKFLRGDATWADVGGYFEIRVTKSGDTYTADKTYNEIKVAIESGLTPVCRMKRQAADAILDDVFYYYNWQIIDGNPDANAFTFNNMSNSVSRFIAIYNSGTVYYFDDKYNFYTLPTATSTTLGGVKPVAKTDAMTQDVGVDKNGKLYTEPAEGGSDLSLGITGATIGQIVKVTAVDTDGKPTAWKPVDDRLPSVTANDDGNILIVRQISEFEAAYVLEHMPNINDFINLGITDASPGQFAKVLAVDELGQPISWKAVDMPSGGGSPSSALICDVTLAEAVQAVSQTLEHNFYALHCIVNCGTSGVTLLVDADGTAQKGYINMLLDTVAQSDLSKLCGATYFGGMTWKTHLMHAIWSPDRTYFEQAMNATLENRINAAVNQSFGGIANMKGTIGPFAVSPDSGRTVNIVAPANMLLNAGVRVIIWGEYYE